MEPFDPHSPHAMFATILQRLGDQDKNFAEHRKEIKSLFDDSRKSHKDVDERVTSLEKESWRNRGIVAVIALAVPAAWHYLTGSKS